MQNIENEKTFIVARVAEPEVKYPTLTPTFPKFPTPTPDSDSSFPNFPT